MTWASERETSISDIQSGFFGEMCMSLPAFLCRVRMDPEVMSYILLTLELRRHRDAKQAGHIQRSTQTE